MNTKLDSQVIPLKSTMSDNWFYLLVSGDACVLVDPVDSGVAIEAVRSRRLTLSAVVNTHWHPDHVAGDDDVCKAFPKAELLVAAGDHEKIAGLISTKATALLNHGDLVRIGESAWTVLATPGHTHGHVSLQLGADFLGGDTLFAAGAGHCRSGDPKVLFDTFENVIRQLPTETQFYPGHDYAVRNLEFALSIEDAALGRDALKNAGDVVGFRPVFLKDEKLLNPFLRVWEASYQEIVRSHAPEVWKAWSQRTTSSAETAFCVLRELRNSW
jgi:hydroxyacylglutathione hydrolase